MEPIVHTKGDNEPMEEMINWLVDHVSHGIRDYIMIDLWLDRNDHVDEDCRIWYCEGWTMFVIKDRMISGTDVDRFTVFDNHDDALLFKLTWGGQQ
jgi:hypothetical protein